MLFPTVPYFKRKLQNSMLKHSNNVTIKESMQNDVCKITSKLQEMKEKKEAQLNSMDRLASMITLIEEEMVLLRKKYEKAVQRRNERYGPQTAQAVKGTGSVPSSGERYRQQMLCMKTRQAVCGRETKRRVWDIERSESLGY